MARSFNGTSDIINIGTPSVLDITGNITLSVWVYPAAFPAAGANQAEYFEKGYDGTNQQYVLRFNGEDFQGVTTNAPYLQALTFGTNAIFGATVPFSESLNTWTHTAGRCTGTTWDVFQNGSSSGQTQQNGHAPFHAAANVSIGAAFISGSAARFLSGRMADAAIWNVALTQLEITALSLGARPYTIRPLSLVGYWPLDGIQTTEPDLSGNASNGTLTGTASAFGPPMMQFTPRWPQEIFTTAAAAAAAANVPLRMRMGIGR